MRKTRCIVVAGGVISGVGKGVITASLGKILQEHGYTATLIKIDPYINYDAGTLRPTEHGEVWVTADGGEIDQDLGTYERFLDQAIPKQNSITTGQIYQSVIDKERSGKYLGETVMFIPHIVDEIATRIQDAAQGYDFAVVEIGGTVGDYENLPFVLAFKSLMRDHGADFIASVLVTYLPVPDHIGEMKVRPTLQAVRMLSEQGILPNFLVCRSKTAIDSVRQKKIEASCNIPMDHIIKAPDLSTVYEMPIVLENQDMGLKLLKHFGLSSKRTPDWTSWRARMNVITHSPETIKIAIVGKYVESGEYALTDSYLSISHALIHAGAALVTRIELVWIDAKKIATQHDARTELAGVAGVIVPGGFGTEGVEGKINMITYARTQKLPYLGICYGMQLAVVEYARTVCCVTDAHTTEVDPHTAHPVVTMLPIQEAMLAAQKYGGTMRLGEYSAELIPGSLMANLYGSLQAKERHRHRYEVNPLYVPMLEQQGLVCSGTYTRVDGTTLVECIELPGHPFFMATQAHPEFTSRFMEPNPLFKGFVQASQSHAVTHNLYAPMPRTFLSGYIQL